MSKSSRSRKRGVKEAGSLMKLRGKNDIFLDGGFVRVRRMCRLA